MDLFAAQDQEFIHRHIGPDEDETSKMLASIGVKNLDELLEKTIPPAIRLKNDLHLPSPVSEYQYLQELRGKAGLNQVFKSFIGQGYYDTITPSVILRNVFENPGWYTQYTPYQAEISQGRLECLLNFQTLVSDLTGLPIANASLLDEGTAAAEAMSMLYHIKNKNQESTPSRKFFVDHFIFPQTREVILTRSIPLGIELIFGDYRQQTLDQDFFGALIQYPNSEGSVEDYSAFITRAHEQKTSVVVACDILSLTLLTPPGELGADIAIGSSQRLGVPLGFGGPHAAFFATREDFKRIIPGRIIGISVDAQGQRALRMALQTREQHIRREKATSNICTAQALLANMAALYAVYHGPERLKQIAQRIHLLTNTLNKALKDIGYQQLNNFYFDTIRIPVGPDLERIRTHALKAGLNFYYPGQDIISISLDETTLTHHLKDIIRIFSLFRPNKNQDLIFPSHFSFSTGAIPKKLQRQSPFLLHPVFNQNHSETKMMRYIKSLENKDLALNTSMISLGSCTMKLNAATELIPISWPEFSSIHPFAPKDQVEGYHQILEELAGMLLEITGLSGCSLQPNSGAQGEFAGLLVIRSYHQSIGQGHRNVVLIPISAHGTNPASAVMAGMKVVVVKCDDLGNIDISDLQIKAQEHQHHLAALMVTYPSTHGVFEEGIQQVCQIIHEYGGQVYLDGANLNAQVGLTSPGLIGADVCHLNLHKTFAIPHGGGGPGMGPICVANHLCSFLPGKNQQSGETSRGSNTVSSAPYGSASILLISYGYIRLLGYTGIKKATEYAILNANYMKSRLETGYQILYSGKQGTCAHEFIVDLRPFKNSCQIEAEDVAKRLMDYGFHAPTLSFPVPGTLMVEPTESEDLAELDRFCDAMLSIREEIRLLESGLANLQDNPLKNAPHTQAIVLAEGWNHPYSRTTAAFPLNYLKSNKFWPAISRVNNTQGDRNLICACEPIEAYSPS
ncbi:MAG: aminomethyl-transferring glycine dehydrogenase [Chitinophagaceae bacterium]